MANKGVMRDRNMKGIQEEGKLVGDRQAVRQGVLVEQLNSGELAGQDKLCVGGRKSGITLASSVD